MVKFYVTLYPIESSWQFSKIEGGAIVAKWDLSAICIYSKTILSVGASLEAYDYIDL